MIKVFKNNTFMIRFLVPIFIGLALGMYIKYLDNLDIAMFFAQISEIIQSLIEYFAPFMVLIYITSAIISLSSKDFGSFITKYSITLFITLFLCVLFSIAIAYIFVPLSITQFPGFDEAVYIDPYFYMPNIAILNPFYAIIIAFILGFSLKYLRNDKLNFVVKKSEHYLNYIVKHVLLNLIPIWIISSFVVSTIERGGGNVIVMDIILSIIILIAQVLWLVLNYLLSTKLNISRFKQMLKSGTKIYTAVTSMAGMSTGAIVPIIIDEQVKLGYEEEKAKFISVTSFNMPGSLISNIIFAYGIILLYDLNVTLMQFFSYAIVLALTLIVAPALPLTTFATTQSLLEPLLGFKPNMISLMSNFYFRQGTSNSAVNNSADFYMAGYTDFKKKENYE